MAFIQHFKKFILRGNLVDLAIGFTVGAAFSTVAKSLVNDILMPPIGLVTGDTDFADKFILLRAGSEELAPYATLKEAEEAGAVTLNYGEFVNNLLSLLIVAIAMFMVIRAYNMIESRLEVEFGEDKPPEEPEHRKCPHCRMTIPYRAVKCGHCTSSIEQIAA